MDKHARKAVTPNSFGGLRLRRHAWQPGPPPQRQFGALLGHPPKFGQPLGDRSKGAKYTGLHAACGRPRTQ
eukprot:6975315-Alexandrium_andersonii.AAC.1